MVEAVKPKTSKQTVNKQIELIENEHGQIDDLHLERRLKSLKSFINNMDPKEKEPDEVVQDNKNDIKDINLPLKLNSASNMSIKNEEIETELIDVPPLVKPLEASAPILTEVKPIKPQQTLLYPIV